MRRVVIICLILASFLLPLTAKESSLITTGNSLLKDDNSLVSSSSSASSELVTESRDLVNESRDLVSESRSLVSESRDLVNESRDLTSNGRSLVSESRDLVNESRDLVSESRSLISEGKSSSSEEEFNSYGSFVSSRESSYSDTYEEVYCLATLSSEQETTISSYLGDYDRYLAITLDGDSTSFVRYFAEWERNGAEGDFYSYVESEVTISNLYENAKKKFGVGTAVILFDIALYFIPGGTLYKAMVLVPLKYAASQAAIGTVTGAVYGAVSATLQGKDSREVFAYALSGAADGYMVGTITGTLSGWGEAIKTYHGAYAISKDMIVLRNNELVNLSGKKIGFVRDSVVYDLDGNISGIISSNGLYDDVTRYSNEAWENAAENFYVGIADDTVGNLSSVKNSLTYYSENGYFDINSIMEGSADAGYYEASYLSELYDKIDDIMYATTNTTVPETISVWRGMSDFDYQTLKEAGAFSKFLSTSVTGIPDDFVSNPVHMEIIVEKGEKGIYIAKYSKFPIENEILLAPSNIEILSEEIRDGKTIVKAVIRALTD